MANWKSVLAFSMLACVAGFFVLGAIVLTTVNVKEGKAAAQVDRV